MKRTRPFAAFLLSLLILVPLSCAAPDAGGGTAIDRFDRVNSSVDSLTDSYEQGNVDSFMGGVGRDYDLDYGSLERAVQDELSRYTGLDVFIVVDRVLTDSSGSIVFADTHWTKRRVAIRTGKEQKESGRTTFIFRITEGGNLVLKGMKGDRLYGAP
jgi:hypothetical protein